MRQRKRGTFRDILGHPVLNSGERISDIGWRGGGDFAEHGFCAGTKWNSVEHPARPGLRFAQHGALTWRRMRLSNSPDVIGINSGR